MWWARFEPSSVFIISALHFCKADVAYEWGLGRVKLHTMFAAKKKKKNLTELGYRKLS